MKKIFSALLLFSSLLLVANNPKPVKIKWISFDEAITLNKTNPKPILIDVYTDWCGWCKKMDQATYGHDKIAAYINKNYYAVKFNAEQRETLTYKGETFNYINNGRNGVHELAYVLLKGKLAYPATVFLDKENNYVEAVPGYLKPTQMEKIITFMAQETYKNSDWETFEKQFKTQL